MGSAIGIVNRLDTWRTLIGGEDMAHFAYKLAWRLAHFATKCTLGRVNIGCMEHFDEKTTQDLESYTQELCSPHAR